MQKLEKIEKKICELVSRFSQMENSVKSTRPALQSSYVPCVNVSMQIESSVLEFLEWGKK